MEENQELKHEIWLAQFLVTVRQVDLRHRFGLKIRLKLLFQDLRNQ